MGHILRMNPVFKEMIWGGTKLKDIYGYKLKEIADMKAMNISTVKSVYYKAIRDMGGN